MMRIIAEIPTTVQTQLGEVGVGVGKEGLLPTIAKYAFGLASVVAVLLVAKGGLQITLSGGDPNKIKEGKEQIVGAISGYFLIMATILILRIIKELLESAGLNVPL